MSAAKDEYVRRVTEWMMPKDPESVALIGELRTLDELYTGNSRRIHKLIQAAYCRGIKRGAGMAWEARQPITFRKGS